MGGYFEVWDSLRQLEINSSRSHLFKATIQGKVQYAGTMVEAMHIVLQCFVF